MVVYQDSASDSRLLGDLVPQVRARHISSFGKKLSLLVGAPIEPCTFVTYNLSSVLVLFDVMFLLIRVSLYLYTVTVEMLI